MSIFEEKKEIGRREFRDILKRDPGTIPDSRRKFTREERVAFEKDVFGKKYGSRISRDDCKDVLKTLEQERRALRQRPAEREAVQTIEDKIQYLKKFADL